MTHDQQLSDRGDEPSAAAPSRGVATRVSVARQSMRDFVVSGRRQTPAAQNAESALRPRRKFSGLQSIEDSQNGERISILRKAVPWAGGTPGAKEKGATHGGRASRVGGDPEPNVDLSSRGASVAGIARERLTANPESPGNGAATT